MMFFSEEIEISILFINLCKDFFGLIHPEPVYLLKP